MGILTVHYNNLINSFEFDGNPSVKHVLETAGFVLPHPCGGRGSCGKCTVDLEGAVSEPNDIELHVGARLSCQTFLLGDATVYLPNDYSMIQVEAGSGKDIAPSAPMSCDCGAAIDIGTTTLVLILCDLKSGKILSSSSCLNPQTAVAADVMGRISAALDGKIDYLRNQVIIAIYDLLEQACAKADVNVVSVNSLVITGNTTMLYLLTGRNPESLSRAPFQADYLYGVETEVLDRRSYLPACMNAFVGADITCAILACGMTKQSDIALLCDVGTNGEIALWKNHILYVASTAAGPAFEGAGISCGCGSIPGAIESVWVEDGKIRVHTISNAPAHGLCGSGLIDAIAAYRTLGEIDETGAVDKFNLPLSDNVNLLPKDIRAVQLAKSAIAAGIQTILDTADTDINDVSRFFIAGGFGSHLNVDSAIAIGLIPSELQGCVHVIGNAALDGALSLLLDKTKIIETQSIAESACHVNLGGNAKFNTYYLEHMMFPEL